MKPRTNRWGGLTYFASWGFSINEGVFPNVHMSWRDRKFFFYLGLFSLFGKRARIWFSVPLPFRTDTTRWNAD